MATSKWKQVKVKVNGRTVTRWSDGRGNYRTRKPAESAAGILSNAAQTAYDALGGNRGPSAEWQRSANAVRGARRTGGQVPASQRADSASASRSSASQRRTNHQSGNQHYGPGGNPNGSGQGQAQQAPPAPELPAPPSSSSSSSGSSRSGSSRRSSSVSSSRSRSPQSSDMDANYAAWAKANRSLAEKVKPGQAGYAAIQKALGNTTSSTSSTSGQGPVKSGEDYGNQLNSNQVSGVGPVKDGSKYSADVEASKTDGQGPWSDNVRYGNDLNAAKVEGTGPVKSGKAYAERLAAERRRKAQAASQPRNAGSGNGAPGAQVRPAGKVPADKPAAVAKADKRQGRSLKDHLKALKRRMR